MDIMEIITEIVPVIGITFLCFLIGKGLKAWDVFDDRKIPILMGVSGVILGVVVYFVEPELLGAAGGIITAIIKGAVSGWAATGIDQIGKQAKKGDIE